MKRFSRVLLLLPALALASASGAFVAQRADAGDAGEAHAIVRDATGTRIASVQFAQADDRVDVSVDMAAGRSVGAGFHGFHIHADDRPETGTGCTADPRQPANTWFSSADGHYARPGQAHGRHTGDMPSLLVSPRGAAQLTFGSLDARVRDLVGKAVIVHAGPDNFGNVPVGRGSDRYTPNADDATATTGKTGSAGDRLACGVIESG